MRSPWVFVLLFCSLISSSLSERCHPYDKRALLKIKKDLGNPQVLQDWDPKSETDCCYWSSVACDEKNRVAYMTLSGGLSGQIPASIGNLPTLEELVFMEQPDLTGPIPPAIAKLKNLQSLTITNSSISGPVPDFLGQLTKLTYIDLSSNKLTGSIPSSLSKLPNVRELHLSKNKLTGSIPESFGEIKTTKDSFQLFLQDNQLSGKIPTSLGQVNFGSFDFSRNKLEGDASFLLIGAKRNTTYADLSRNLLEFDLSNVKRLPKIMWYLDLSHNKITGGIPNTKSYRSLSYLNVSYNRLCGQIPVGGKLQSLGYSSYFHNKCLCGSPLPSCK